MPGSWASGTQVLAVPAGMATVCLHDSASSECSVDQPLLLCEFSPVHDDGERLFAPCPHPAHQEAHQSGGESKPHTSPEPLRSDHKPERALKTRFPRLKKVVGSTSRTSDIALEAQAFLRYGHKVVPLHGAQPEGFVVKFDGRANETPPACPQVALITCPKCPTRESRLYGYRADTAPLPNTIILLPGGNISNRTIIIQWLVEFITIVSHFASTVTEEIILL
ncbi:unnamed protein product [Rangifer tarandus platyrhynchus]|uniref:Uncharacterized protein n=1 Tax=Rangifer tarandus platyrhynchus TaxID=3082113 RepID=A0AC59YB88_RANTA